MTAQERYEAFTRPEGNCRIWTRAASHRHSKPPGYGSLWIDKKCLVAHRYFYESFVGPVPAGKQLHHICLNSLCCNPAHLQVVSSAEHTAVEPGHVGKRTHCPKGHAYTPENTKRLFAPGSNGKRYWKRACRACHRLTSNRTQAARKAVQRHQGC